MSATIAHLLFASFFASLPMLFAEICKGSIAIAALAPTSTRNLLLEIILIPLKQA
jgi:hypothetical protein